MWQSLSLSLISPFLVGGSSHRRGLPLVDGQGGAAATAATATPAAKTNRHIIGRLLADVCRRTARTASTATILGTTTTKAQRRIGKTTTQIEAGRGQEGKAEGTIEKEQGNGREKNQRGRRKVEDTRGRSEEKTRGRR